MKAALNKRLDMVESQIMVSMGSDEVTVGFVDPEKGFTHALTWSGSEWKESDKSPNAYLPAKLEVVLLSNKRFIGVVGGRGSGKSNGIGDICIIKARTHGDKTYCLREFQSSIKNSVYSLIRDEIHRLNFDGFDVQTTSIRHNGADCFEFLGISRNIDSIKSAHNFKRYWVEESQFITDDSLTALTPTARKAAVSGLPIKFLPEDQKPDADIADDVSMIFVANPGSSQDPFSKRFIVPFQKELDRDGIYEDDLHLIVKMNYCDNPWFEQSGLEEERQWDFEHRSRELYDHVWLGGYNDYIEDAIILAEWFDACIDAHLKLRFPATGAKFAAHDPSDTGPDDKAIAVRHGSVVVDVQSYSTGDGNEGADWATGIANFHQVDYFTWDCDGLGATLNRQIDQAFSGKKTEINQFKGSQKPDWPSAPCNSTDGIAKQMTWEQVVKNKRAQYYMMLRDRVYRTYRAVVHGEWTDPDDMISFSSDIEELGGLRSELCRMPKKPNANGKFELYTKDDMRTKFKLPSPNLADSVMMLMRHTNKPSAPVRKPRPLKTVQSGKHARARRY